MPTYKETVLNSTRLKTTTVQVLHQLHLFRKRLSLPCHGNVFTFVTEIEFDSTLLRIYFLATIHFIAIERNLNEREKSIFFDVIHDDSARVFRVRR